MANIFIEIDGIKHILVKPKNDQNFCETCSLSELCNKAHKSYGGNLCDPFGAIYGEHYEIKS